LDRVFKRLPTRIVFFVFAVTLITSLTVTAVSVNSTGDFLRGKINQQIPATLTATSEKIDGWYDDRLREIEVFSSSEVLQRILPTYAAGRSEGLRQRAGVEVIQYLSYLLDDFPQYTALFVLPVESPDQLSVGRAPTLPDAWRRDLAGIQASQIGSAASWAGQRLQIASTPIQTAEGVRVGTLHAVIQTDLLSDLLGSSEIAENAALKIVNSEGDFLASSRGMQVDGKFDGTLPEVPSPGKIILEDYENNEGALLVGGLSHLDRFGWWLVYEQPYREAFAPVVSVISRVTVINLAIVIVMCLAAFWIAVSIVRPIEGLSRAAKRISEGQRDVEIPSMDGSDEVAVLSRAFHEMTMRLTNNAAELELSHATIEETNERLRQKNDQLQQMNEILEQLSITDGLTKLHNHRYFQEALTKACKRSGRTDEPLALILIDIDSFKDWNDRLGHAGGDEILRQMADVLNDGIRETDVLARYGGEEFAILAPDTQILGAAKLAEKLRSDIAATGFLLDPPSEHSQVTVSIGVAIYCGDRGKLFTDADGALYSAKDAGRDCVVIAESDSTEDPIS
jgi:diguanylate cyclase (GGDEF)-like protein